MKVTRWAFGLIIALLAAVAEPLLWAFRKAMQTTRTGRALPRVVHFAQHAWQKRGYGKLVAGGRGAAFRIGFAQIAVACIALVVLAGVLSGASAAGFALAITPAATRDVKTIIAEMKEIQDRNKGKQWPDADSVKFRELGAEGKALQDEADREKEVKALQDFARQVPDPTLPPDSKDTGADGVEFKNGRLVMPDMPVAYLALGKAFTSSPEFRAYIDANMPMVAGSSPMKFGSGSPISNPMVPLTLAQVKALVKAVPTIGASVVPADRVVAPYGRTIAQAKARLRDVINVSQTNSNSVIYSIVSAFTRAVAPVAESGTKPEAALTIGTGTAPVRTLAVHMPVTEQQLQDVPQIENIIDVWLRWDLERTEEDQAHWGAGTGENFTGINNSGITVGRTVAGDTFVDMIRRMVTDITVAGFEPNAFTIHPVDLETVELAKATGTGNYLYVVINDPNTGLGRIWGLTPVETVAGAEPGAFTTPARRIVVGDFLRGATLWDRMQAAVAVGYINDQFITNRRTIRLEERAAFGVTAPLAFRYRETQARVP